MRDRRTAALARSHQTILTEIADPPYASSVTQGRHSAAAIESDHHKVRRIALSFRPFPEGNHYVNYGTNELGHILIVDDDPLTRLAVTRYFEEHNVPTTSCVSNRTELTRHIATTPPRLILLDLQLDRKDGLDLLRSIRSYSNVPVIITVHRSDNLACVVGLELGADHYIVKPFSLRELLARMRAVLRRDQIGRAMHALAPERGGYRFGGWQLDCHYRRLFNPAGMWVPLSNTEYALLLTFLESPKRLLSREQLLLATRLHEDIRDRSVDVQVCRLRRKLEPGIIQTERGAGYIFAQPVDRI